MPPMDETNGNVHPFKGPNPKNDTLYNGKTKTKSQLNSSTQTSIKSLSYSSMRQLSFNKWFIPRLAGRLRN